MVRLLPVGVMLASWEIWMHKLRADPHGRQSRSQGHKAAGMEQGLCPPVWRRLVIPTQDGKAGWEGTTKRLSGW